MGKREPPIILKTDERSIHLELGRERSGWGEKRDCTSIDIEFSSIKFEVALRIFSAATANASLTP
jgi:hypothetical protein